jgi:predicted component of type VI protein secretion system
MESAMSAMWEDAADRKCRSCAADYESRIADLEAGVEAGKRAALTVREYCEAMRDIEEVLDTRRTPDPYPGKTGVPCRVEALVDAWADASMALVDLLANPDSPAAKDHAQAVLVASRFGVRKY